MADYGIWQGLEKATGNMANTGMKLMEFQANRAHQEALEKESSARLTIAQDQAARDKAAFMNAEKKRLEQEAVENAFVPASTVAPNIMNLPKSRKRYIDALESAGYKVKQDPDEVYVQVKGLKFLQGLRASSQEFRKGSAEDTLADLKDANNAIAQQIAELRGAGKADDDKALAPLLAKQKAIKGQVASMYSLEEGFVKEEQKQKAALELAEANRENKVPPHGVTEITSPDGKTAQKMQYNPATNKYDIPVGEKYPVKSQVVNINTAAQSKESFDTWTPQEKEQAFGYNMITGKPPENARGMRANDRQAYAKGYAKWQVEKGYKPSDIALMQSDYRAGNMSLSNMAKQEAPMHAFVGNINKQIEKVQQLFDNNDRTGIRLLDLPVREIKMRAKGSGDEAVKASYLLEISNEIGKLSSGASASVQQLSDSAKEDWKRVHDPNLSLKEIMKVVNATRDQANMRLSTWKEAKEAVRDQLRGLGVPDTTQAATHQYIPGKGIVEIK